MKINLKNKDRVKMQLYMRERQLTGLNAVFTALSTLPAGHTVWEYINGQLTMVHIFALALLVLFKWNLDGQIHKARFLLNLLEADNKVKQQTNTEP